MGFFRNFFLLVHTGLPIENAVKTYTDYIGKPDPSSNLRPMKFHMPENESEIETLHRIERTKVQEWNQQFWARHNLNFIEEKERFLKENVMDENDGVNKANKMSVFYKYFLDKNWNNHCTYNVEWYKRNAYVTFLSLQVNLFRFIRNIKNKFVP